MKDFDSGHWSMFGLGSSLASACCIVVEKGGTLCNVFGFFMFSSSLKEWVLLMC